MPQEVEVIVYSQSDKEFEQKQREEFRKFYESLNSTKLDRMFPRLEPKIEEIFFTDSADYKKYSEEYKHYEQPGEYGFTMWASSTAAAFLFEEDHILQEYSKSLDLDPLELGLLYLADQGRVKKDVEIAVRYLITALTLGHRKKEAITLLNILKEEVCSATRDAIDAELSKYNSFEVTDFKSIPVLRFPVELNSSPVTTMTVEEMESMIFSLRV